MATFLNFSVRQDDTFLMRLVADEVSKLRSDQSYSSYGTETIAAHWSFMLSPDTRWGAQNQQGILLAHRVEMGRKAFEWPGVLPQPLGHDNVTGHDASGNPITLNDVTITEDASEGDNMVTIASAINVKNGRIIRLPGVSRVHVVVGVTPQDAGVGLAGPTDIKVEPTVRRDIKANTKMALSPTPHVLYHPDDQRESRMVNGRQGNPIRLVER